jgi:hypothetical protein
LGLLRADLAQATTGEFRFVVLEGEPGVSRWGPGSDGKTDSLDVDDLA